MLYHQNSSCNTFLRRVTQTYSLHKELSYSKTKTEAQWDRCGLLWIYLSIEWFRYISICENKKLLSFSRNLNIVSLCNKISSFKDKTFFYCLHGLLFKLFLMFYNMKNKSTFFFLNLGSKKICRLSDAERLLVASFWNIIPPLCNKM